MQKQMLSFTDNIVEMCYLLSVINSSHKQWVCVCVCVSEAIDDRTILAELFL